MRIVLIHHPPLPEHSRERGLLDSETFERALLDVGAELVLHGHNHRDMISWRDTATGPVPIIGAGCAALGRYNVYDLIWNGPGAASHIEVQHRGLHPPDGRVVEISRARLDPDPKIRRRII